MNERDEAILRLGRIEQKLDNALEKLLDHERRIRRTEYSIWAGTGIMVAVSAMAHKLGISA